MESSPYTHRVIHPRIGSPVPMSDSAKTFYIEKVGSPNKGLPTQEDVSWSDSRRPTAT